MYCFSALKMGTGSNTAVAASAETMPSRFKCSLAIAMIFGRFLPMLFVLALAGRFASARRLPASAGTLPTDRPLFVVLLTGVALVVVGLTFVPVLMLGPIAESLS